MPDDLRNMTLDDEVQHFLEACRALDGQEVSETSAPEFRRLQTEEVKLRRKLDDARKTEKEPHLQAGRDVDARYQPKISSVQDAIKAVTRALTKFLEAEEARQRAEAEAKRKAAAEEARRAAELAAQAKAQEEDDPFAAFDGAEQARKAEAEAAALARQAAAPVKASVASSDGARSGGLRTVGYIVTVTDAAALIAHYADRSEFVELAVKLANADARASKGQAKIPGVAIAPDRRAA